jgi:hypothetical protein
MMADFTTFDEFGRNRSHHDVAAVRAAHRRSKGTDSGELRPIFMKLHVTASYFSPVHAALSNGASWQGRDALMKLWWPDR